MSRESRRIRLILLGMVSVAVLAALLPETAASADNVSVQQVKAAFLFNFARYVEWPDTAFGSETDPIVIGIYGDKSFPEVVRSVIAGREAGGRPLKIVAYSGLDQAAKSHILFIGSSQAENHRAIIDTTKRKSVFAVSDSPGFAKAGGVANFLFIDKRVRFEINERAAKDAGLTLSSRLLRLAMLVD